LPVKFTYDAPDIIKEFLNYLQTIKGKSIKTVDEYYLDLRTFFRFIKQERGLVDVSTEFCDIKIDDVNLELIKSVTLTDCYEFMNFAMRERNNANSARSRKSSALRTFYHYLVVKKNYFENDPTKDLESPKTRKSLPKYLTLEQSLELLNSVEGEFKERDCCILTLFLNCGMRLAELVGINLSDIRSDNSLRLLGKGNKERTVYLNESCVYAINNYKAVRPVNCKDKKALFISRQMNRISPKTVQAIVYKYLEKIGLDAQGYSCHKLRHTAATLMYQHGQVDIRVLKEVLGHQNLGTTEIYTHLNSEQLAKASNANPLAHITKKKVETNS